MKTSSRPRDLGGSFASRKGRGHAAQLSISDTNYHVSEVIGDMYGEEDDIPKNDSRPLSFITSPLSDSVESRHYYEPNKTSRSRPPPTTNGNAGKKPHTSPAMLQSPRSNAFEKSQLSPSLSLREHKSADTANSQFPLNDIDYETDPTAIAQELNNLQALRRMSMDVGNTSDPDLPSFQGVSLMPSIAPTGNDDEDDPSRLFWVPARVHPELAPMEFKTFLENRVQTIKRRSGDQTSLSPDGIERSESGGGLRRKKSMLSRQIDNDGGRGAVGYKDGAEQLERKKSVSSSHHPELRISDLADLDALVRDPSKAMRKLSLDTAGGQYNGPKGDEDMPILPQAPGGPGIGLRRSTHTTYRRGSLRKGERVPFSKRAGSLRGAETDGEDSPTASPIDGRSPVGFPLIKVSSEPVTTENFSRPSRGGLRQLNVPRTKTSNPELVLGNDRGREEDILTRSSSNEDIIKSPPQPGSVARSNTFPRNDAPVPKIIETPPPPEDVQAEGSEQKEGHQSFPERSSSQVAPATLSSAEIPEVEVVPEPPARSSRRPILDRQPVPNQLPPTRESTAPNKTLNDMVQRPSPLPGSSGSTETLTFIPTLEEKKPDKKTRKEKDESESSSRKPSWGWFKGSDEREKKDKKKVKEREDDHTESKKGKGKLSVDKIYDNARLDVLQSTVDSSSPRGRESLLLDRDSIDSKLLDERKKESSRKSGGENKKEKDGLFSSFFGGKKKSDRDSGGKKGSSLRTLSPDPPHRELKPDIDYNWTRFSILEERAIYRMAHIKLANPRRALQSQVLLSNFMYSYLAKVQQMHPQMQIPQSAQQKKQEAERRQKEQEQQVREEELQRQGHEEQYRYDYHQGITQYAESQHNSKNEGVSYVDDSQIYDYDHQSDHSTHGHRPQSRQSQHSSDNGYGDPSQQYGQHYGNDYYQSHDHRNHHDEENDDDDMW